MFLRGTLHRWVCKHLRYTGRRPLPSGRQCKSYTNGGPARVCMVSIEKIQPEVTGWCVACLRDSVHPMSVWHVDMCVLGVVPGSPRQIHSPAH